MTQVAWRLDETADDGEVTLRPQGDLDLDTAGELREAVRARALAGARAIRVDLAEVDFVDSSGVGALVVCRRTCDDLGCGFAVANPSGSAQAILRVTGLDRLLVAA